MNLKHIMIASAIAASLASCSGNNQDWNDVIIEKPEFVSQDGQFTIEALEALGRVSDIKVSPDGKKVLFAISYESVEHNKSNADLYTMNIDGSDLKRITRTPASENGFTWIAGGECPFSTPKFTSLDAWKPSNVLVICFISTYMAAFPRYFFFHSTIFRAIRISTARITSKDDTAKAAVVLNSL